jgi:ketosteroid isomerase-like protein
MDSPADENLEKIARASYVAFAARDRGAHEKLLAKSFHFTSPLDNRIDRATFYERCWPNGDHIDGFDFVVTAVRGERVFVVYEGVVQGDGGQTGRRFRNTEILTIRNGQIVEAEVYFGWNLPHEAREGSFVNP